MTNHLKDLTPSNIERIEARMRPGAYSVSGFLGPNEKLVEIIERDAELVVRLGVTHEAIADRLDFLVQRRQQLESDRAVKETVEKDRSGRWVRGYEVAEGIIAIRPVSYLGHQFCPFESRDETMCDDKGSIDHLIYNVANDKTLRFSELLIHLIRAHHFFEGSVPYRADPREIVEVA